MIFTEKGATRPRATGPPGMGHGHGHTGECIGGGGCSWFGHTLPAGVIYCVQSCLHDTVKSALVASTTV